MSQAREDMSTRWSGSKKALKAVQFAFDTSEEMATRIRLEAVNAGITPSDLMRQIVGLPVRRRPVRPRLTVSLSDEDFCQLANKYDLDPDDRVAIRRRVMEDVFSYLE